MSKIKCTDEFKREVAERLGGVGQHTNAADKG